MATVLVVQGRIPQEWFSRMQLNNMFSFGRRADRCCATPSWPCSHVFAENSLPWLTDLWIECARNLLRLRLCSRGLRLPPHVGEFRRIGHLGACPKAFLYCCNVKPLLSN